jgi:large subunit ribosomal protein L9
MKGKTQKLLLNDTIKKVGKVGDVVEVSSGYARNYLIPHGLAVMPTPSNLKRVEERRKEVERVEKQRRAGQEAMIKKLEGVEVTLERRANEQGHLFGSVSATDISHALSKQGFEVEAGDIYLPGKLDRVEKYTVIVSFADDLKTDVKVWVAPDSESKAAMDAYKKDHPAPASPQA